MRTAQVFSSCLSGTENVTTAFAESGPLDFPSKKSFTYEKELGHTFQK